jgi:hypothetical protein
MAKKRFVVLLGALAGWPIPCCSLPDGLDV